MPRAAQEQSYEEEFEDEPGQGQGAEGDGQDGGQGPRQADGAPDDDGSQQTSGRPEDLDPDDEDDFLPAPSRRQETTAQRLDREVAELRAQNAELTRRLTTPPQAQTTRVNQPSALQESEEQFQARIALLNPEERMEARAVRAEARQEQRLQLMQFQQAEQADRAAFDAKCSLDQRYKRWQDRVEARHRELWQAGTPAPRETILRYMIGDAVVAGQVQTKAQAQRGKQRVARQTVRPSNAGSDVQAGRRGQLSERDARARRLENMQI